MRIDFSQLCSRWAALLPRRRQATHWAVASLRPGQMSAVVVTVAAAGARPQVLHAATLDHDDTLPMADALSAFARDLQAGGQGWALLLPRDDYRLSVIPEPEVPAAELAQSVRWQLAATIDFAVEDAAVDFIMIPTREHAPQRTPELYAVAARGDRVNAFAALFRHARLDLRAIDIRETAQRNIAARLERDDELLVMVAFCDDEVQISFSWRHELYMDRLIAEPACHDDDAERRATACERIRMQLQRSLDAVRADFPFMQAARIVLAGAPDGFLAQLQAGLFDPVEALLPDTLFDLTRVPQLQDARHFMHHFHALGVALRDTEAAR